MLVGHPQDLIKEEESKKKKKRKKILFGDLEQHETAS